MKPLRILITDDHPLFRRGLRTLLSALPDVEVVGGATSAEEAVARTAELQPDVVLMDLQMPGGSGITAIRAISQAHPAVSTLVVTLFEDESSVFTALRAGARGYVLKDAEEEEMIRAIRAVATGEAIFSPAIATRVMSFFAAPPPGVVHEAFPTLTEREREILTLLARGQSNVAIATGLGLSLKTISNNVSTIFGKLQVADRAEAISKARDAGLGT